MYIYIICIIFISLYFRILPDSFARLLTKESGSILKYNEIKIINVFLVIYIT